MRLFIGIFFSLILALPTMASEEKYSESDLLDRPLMERYILDELKALRQDYQSLEKRMITEITDRELTVADKSLNYANVTVYILLLHHCWCRIADCLCRMAISARV